MNPILQEKDVLIDGIITCGLMKIHTSTSRHISSIYFISIYGLVVGNDLIEPFELPPRLNGQNYLNFLQTQLPILLENVPLNIRQNMFFQHDGAPAHSSRNVTRFLNDVFPGKWIGSGGTHN